MHKKSAPATNTFAIFIAGLLIAVACVFAPSLHVRQARAQSDQVCPDDILITCFYSDYSSNGWLGYGCEYQDESGDYCYDTCTPSTQ